MTKEKTREELSVINVIKLFWSEIRNFQIFDKNFEWSYMVPNVLRHVLLHLVASFKCYIKDYIVISYFSMLFGDMLR